MHKPNSNNFTAHSLERGLERIMGLEGPYTQKQYDDIREFIIKSIEWNPFTEAWVIVEFEVELVIVGHRVVTTVPMNQPIQNVDRKKICDFQKVHKKKWLNDNKSRNQKSKDRE